MKTFTDIDGFLNELIEDRELQRGSAQRYPIRFILLDDFKHYNSLISAIDVGSLDLSDLLEHDEGWLGRSSLYDTFSEINDTVVVFPLSEIIRFYKERDAHELLSSMSILQNKHGDNIRIYVPLVGITELFSSFWNNFHRKEEGPPVWRLKTPREEFKNITINLCDERVTTKKAVITNNKQWLNRTHKEVNEDIIVKNNSLKERWSEFLPNGCFDKKEINNPKDFFAEIYGLNFYKPFIDQEYDYWNRLLSSYEATDINRDLSTELFLKNQIDVASFRTILPEELVELYFRESGTYWSWLITVFAYHMREDDSYVLNILKKLNQYDPKELIKELYWHILNDPIEKHICERKKVIESLHVQYSSIADEFIDDFISQVGVNDNEVDLITNYTIKEKSYILKHFIKTDNLDALKERLPELKDYLDWNTLKYSLKINEKFANYFSEYALSKLKNKKTQDYERVFDALNGDLDKFYKWIYHVDKIPEQVEDVKIIQLDGVGAEWLPFIYHIIKRYAKSYNKDVKSIEIRKVKKIPTITEPNKIHGAIYNGKYDTTIIHRQDGYKHPAIIFKSMDTVKNLVNDVLETYGEDVVITADHGATCMCQKQFGAKTFKLFEHSPHEGRYMTPQKGLKNENDFFLYEGYYVALKHNTINNINRQPIREVHGGVTPEEMLVPYILVGASEDAGIEKTKVTLQNTNIKYNETVLKVEIHPRPKDIPYIIINSEKRNGILEGKCYRFDITDLKVGDYNLDINVDGSLHNVGFTITGGIIKEDLFG